MINQQLLEYVAEQKRHGYTTDQIRSSLATSGWQPNDIDVALAMGDTQSTVVPAAATPRPRALPKTVGIAVLAVVLLMGTAAAVYMFVVKPKTDRTGSPTASGQQQTAATEQDTGSGGNGSDTPADGQPDTSAPVAQLAGALSSCTPYKTTYKHPITGDILGREITGSDADRCVYTEQMPNNGKMECRLTEGDRSSMAQYYRDQDAAQSTSVDVSADPATGEKTVTYTIDGKTVTNPLQALIDAKTCIISGY